MRVAQALSAYRGPLTVFWLYGDSLGQDFRESVDFLIGFCVRKLDEEKRDGSFCLSLSKLKYLGDGESFVR